MRIGLSKVTVHQLKPPPVCVQLFEKYLPLVLPSTARLAAPPQPVELCCAGHAPCILAPQLRAQLVMKLPGRYLPAAQLTHVSSYATARPALQVQTADPAGEFEPEPHVWHASPMSFLYVPAAHKEHVSPLAPENPSLHVQSVCSSLPLTEYEFIAHA